MSLQGSGNFIAGVRFNSEKKLGIVHYTSPIDFGWSGEIRKRYTDFIVHEVQRDGTIVRLLDFQEAAPELEKPASDAPTTSDAPASHAPPASDNPAGRAPPAKPVEVAKIPEEDAAQLTELVGEKTATALQEAYAAALAGETVSKTGIIFDAMTDRTKRGHVHQEIRRIFSGRFETETDAASGCIVARPAVRRQRNGRRNAVRTGSVVEGRGKYVHFTMYKENKDTMEAINHLSRLLNLKQNKFGIAGTKDRRAATTQRVSVRLDGPVNPARINARNNNIKIGSLQRVDAPIQLGQHGGNEFTIAVKDVQLVRGCAAGIAQRLRMTEACVQAALDHIRQRGFINYFGLQRFGTHAIGTQQVGMRILSGDFAGACDAILHVDEALAASLDRADVDARFMRDEITRARIITKFRAGGDVADTLYSMPRRFSAESAVIEHLTKQPSTARDHCGAILRIARTLRSLYIHAYQSLVWNAVVSRRWAAFGDAVLAGDLVLTGQPAADVAEDDDATQDVRALTADEAASGRYSIFDVVVPAPGFNVLYPENATASYYAEFMAQPENGALDPYNMRRPQQDFSLRGYYRKMVSRFTTIPRFYVRPYVHDEDQMHPTDLDEVAARRPGQPLQVASHPKDDSRRRQRTPEPMDLPSSKRAKGEQGEAQDVVEGGGPVEGEAPVKDTAAPAPQLPSMEDIIKLFDDSGFLKMDDKPQDRAVNLSDVWRSAMPPDALTETMRVAVVLNFRLESSNYATVCMREMMSAAGPEEDAGRGLLGHGGHVHQTGDHV